jgi:hypothetical protein
VPQPSFIPGLRRIAARTPPPPGNWPDPLGHAHSMPQLAVGRQGIAGTVRIDTTPVARVVRLYERSSGRLIREMTSADTGAYGWLNLRDRWRYYVVAVDIQPGGVNAAIADYVHPT